MVSEAQHWIIERLKERNTWFGLLSLLGAAGISLRPDLQEHIIVLGMAVGGIIGIVTEEHGKGR